MNFDLGARRRKAGDSITTMIDARAGWRSRTASSWFMAGLVVLMWGAAACSSGNGSPKDAGSGGMGTGGKAATGGATGTGGVSSTGGRGGSPATDAGPPDAPASDAPASDATLPCIPDGGDASGDCCPLDPNKTQPGVCGCGIADEDIDTDGVIDCNDGCPGDHNKAAPGVCGCGIPDVDTDGDGTLDCMDGCPKDRTRLQPGVCGCGAPDTAAPLCLAHRYKFNDRASTDGGAADGGASDAGDGGVAGTTVVADSVGTAHGRAVGVVLTGTGSVQLAGGLSDQYIELPAGTVSGLGDSATFEAWVTWAGSGGFWQRIFDFGSSNNPPDGRGQGPGGITWLFLTPQHGGLGTLVVSMATTSAGATEAAGATPLPFGSMHHVAVVVDGRGTGDAGGPSLALYADGVLQARSAIPHQLSAINDVNNWLGRSQFVSDAEFAGTYHDFRIYSAALTGAQIQASFNAGPDAP